jgi:ferredoxin
MAYVIAEPCVDRNDRSCVDVCPVDCIGTEPDLDRKLFIDPDVCIDCGACADACPNEAIFREDELPAAWAGYLSVDATWYRDRQAARKALNELGSMA